MMLKKFLLKVLLLVYLTILCFTIKSNACRCADPPYIKDDLKYSDIVFSGTVISKKITNDFIKYGIKTKGDTNTTGYRRSLVQQAVYTIKVDHIYAPKTKIKLRPDTINVFTAVNPSGCGYPFQTCEKYIIYGSSEDLFIESDTYSRYSNNNKNYWTDSCGNTDFWSGNMEIIIIKILRGLM